MDETSTKKILFVDDDPNILSSIRRNLYGERAQWDFYCAKSGKQALELLKELSFDIVVSDYHMPAMDGMEFLSYVEAHYPQAIRIMLTGERDKIQYSHTVNICHYFFWKPLNMQGFKRFLIRTQDALSLLSQPTLAQHLNAITAFPIPPDSYHKLTVALDNPDMTVQQLAYIAGKDIALAMEMFKLSSSVNFTQVNEFETLEEAVLSLNIDTIRALIATQHVLREEDGKICRQFELDRLQRHSFQVMRLAEALAQRTHQGHRLKEIRLAALLHDAGHLILAYAFPVEYSSTMAFRHKNQVTVSVAEQQVLSANHSDVGAYLACLWGVPKDVVEAIHQHNHAAPVPIEKNPVSHLVWHANRMAQGEFDASTDYYEELARDPYWSPYFKTLINQRKRGKTARINHR